MDSYISSTIRIPEKGIEFRIETDISEDEVRSLDISRSFEIHIEKQGALERKIKSMLKAESEIIDDESTD